MGNNIIAFCGRKESGKTELANICVDFGYEKISFATPLKKLIAQLINCDFNDIHKLKNVKSEYIFNDYDCKFISEETNIPYEIVLEKMLNKQFTTVRELLQHIGTDLIRGFNPDWHVNKTKESIVGNKKFVIDDTRFPNEVKMINELGGDCWFVVRPKMDNVSNHESETSLKWQDFDKIIINDKTIEYLKFNWSIFMENGYDESVLKRENILHSCIGNKDSINTICESCTDFTLLDSLFISKHEFTYDAKYLKNTNIDKISVNKDCVMVFTDDDNVDVVTNPLIIEDLKKYI